MSERDARILEILTAEKKVEVSELAQRLGVSSVTIRKDLDALEARCVIERRHDWANLGRLDDINGRLAYHYEEKCRIAKAAAELINEGDTVMIENGSCCALLADELVRTRRDVSIVTNSAFIAAYVRHQPSATNIMCLGGNYQADSQAMVGPILRLCAREFHVPYLFVGTDGWTQNSGFTNADHLRAEAVYDMAENADRVVVLTESVKFGERGVTTMRLDNRSLTVITDSRLTDTHRMQLESLGVTVQIAE